MANRPTKGTAELILKERSAGGRKIVARIEISVANEVERAAVEPIASGLGDDADLTAGEFSVLRVEIAGDDSELSDGIQIGNNGGAGVYILFDVASIHAEIVGELALPVNGDRAGVQSSRWRKGSCAHILHSAGSDGRCRSDTGL